MSSQQDKIEELKTLVNEGDLSDPIVLRDIGILVREITHSQKVKDAQKAMPKMITKVNVRPLTLGMLETLKDLLDKTFHLDSYQTLWQGETHIRKVPNGAMVGLINRKVISFGDDHRWRINDFGKTVLSAYSQKGS